MVQGFDLVTTGNASGLHFRPEPSREPPCPLIVLELTPGRMYALMGVSPMEAAARIKKQLIDTIGTIAARGHAQLLLARLSALALIAAQRWNTTNSNQQIISLNALARAHYRRSIGTRGGAQASAAD
ncbi:hypothetical protein T492DRAFT_889839 [Pavlovales sp. CCMP2436]|nr:hypothetical protein T492DRAFT_889839 [Pavlovales sp. CCMP2436]